MAAVADCAPHRVKPSKRQSRRRRRIKFAATAAKTAREELIRGAQPTIATSPDYHMARACGFDPMAREMRRREPPTRSTNSTTTQRLNRKNAWHQRGDAKVLVSPKEGAAWLWFLTLGDDAQDELYELSAKCGDKGDGISHADADPLDLLRDMPAAKRTVAMEGEDPRAWGRKA